MKEYKISDSLSYVFNKFNGQLEPVFHHPMGFRPQLECPVCHRIELVSCITRDLYKSGYRVCNACRSHGWRDNNEVEYVAMDEFRSKMKKIREVFGGNKTNDTSSNKEETIMPFGKTNFDEVTLTLDTNSISKAVLRILAKPFDIEKVIFNAPATIVKWLDGSKTVVKCGENDEYDPEKGLAMCFAKKALGNKGHYYETFKEWLPEDNNIEENLKDMFLKKMMNAFEHGGKTDGE